VRSERGARPPTKIAATDLTVAAFVFGEVLLQ
jgi:hypothetical protein